MSQLVFIAVVSASALNASPRGANPREQLHTAIPQAIRLLEDRDYERLVDLFVHPDDSDRITTRRDLNRAMRHLGPGNKADRMLTVLNSIKNNHPSYSGDGTIATYDIPWHGLARGSTIRQIHFRKAGKFWYLVF